VKVGLGMDWRKEGQAKQSAKQCEPLFSGEPVVGVDNWAVGLASLGAAVFRVQGQR
jgi:hypothetical protein